MVVLMQQKVRCLVPALFSISMLFFTAMTFAQKDTIEFYPSDNITNQLPLFDNRFHIDAQLDEVTLLFYRVSGTPPVILVRPDGTKLKVNNAIRDGIEWHDDRTFDMIKLKKPMPGPWQAIGSILPESKIMVVSDVNLKVAPLPEILLAGETLKVTAELLNGKSAIDNPGFREVIQLDVEFFSTNNSDFDNFGSEPIQLTSFRDDGYELDEYAGDGVFTGEFELDFSPGQWLPVYSVKLPMVTRRLEQKNVIIQKTPITLSVKTSTVSDKPHKLSFLIDENYVDPDSIVLQGKITYPDRQVEPYSIMEGQGLSREKDIPYTEGGIHRVKTSVFGSTISGREFRLVVPEFSFSVDHQEYSAALASGEEGGNSTELSGEQIAEDKVALAEAKMLALAQEKEQQQRLAQEKQHNTLIMIIVANVLVVLLAALLFFVVIRKKKR